jgi:wobble nucleotide-excising tRNase
MKKIFSILILEENFIELYKVFNDIEAAQKEFKKILKERGLNILEQRKHLKAEFFRDGIWQIQLLKSEVI